MAASKYWELSAETDKSKEAGAGVGAISEGLTERLMAECGTKARGAAVLYELEYIDRLEKGKGNLCMQGFKLHKSFSPVVWVKLMGR